MPTSAVSVAAPTAASTGRAGFRLIPRLDTYPALVRWAQTVPGKLGIMLGFALLMRCFLSDFTGSLLFALVFTLITLAPTLRWPILSVGPVIWVVLTKLHQPLVLFSTLGVMGVGMLLYWAAANWPKSPFGRRPIVFLVAGFSALIAVACVSAGHPRADQVLWTVVGAVASYFWFIAYAVTDKSSRPSSDAGRELATFRPIWGTTNTPFPKGAAYLRRIEAKNPEQLAITQLKGLKLLAWAVLLGIAQTFWFRFFHGYLHIPMADQALALSARGTPAPWHTCWAAQILAFFELILSFSIFGHRFIACARMAGFNALRNTYRPLSATTLIEFFNRFYYYFKELLVDFFFYPAFFRYFKKHRRLRTTFATCAAVIFGDAFYHITRDWHFFRERGFWGGLASYQVEIVYCIVLAISLSISQLRKRAPHHHGFLRGRLLPFCWVTGFYVLISVFETDTRTCNLSQTVRYFASLFFIHY